MLKVYGLDKCSTCQKALAWMDGEKLAYQFTDVKDETPTPAVLASWSKSVGGWEKLINRAGYTWRGLPASETKDLDEKKAAALAAKNPSLIRRPLIEYANGDVTVGFSEKTREKIKP
jgi:arsenate reductase (glutaredoxin)